MVPGDLYQAINGSAYLADRMVPGTINQSSAMCVISQIYPFLIKSEDATEETLRKSKITSLVDNHLIGRGIYTLILHCSWHIPLPGEPARASQRRLLVHVRENMLQAVFL
jgi:hypothetical protein